MARTSPPRLTPVTRSSAVPRPVEDVRCLDANEEVLPRGRAAVAVEADRAERDGKEDDRSGNRLRSREPGEGNPQANAPVHGSERCDPRDVGEEDREALAPLTPRCRGRTRPCRRARRTSRGRWREQAHEGSRDRSNRARGRRTRTAPRLRDSARARSGYTASGRASRPVISQSQTNASASARQGLSARQTLPNSRERNGTPSQKMT